MMKGMYLCEWTWGHGHSSALVKRLTSNLVPRAYREGQANLVQQGQTVHRSEGVDIRRERERETNKYSNRHNFFSQTN